MLQTANLLHIDRSQVFMTRDDLNCQHEPFGDAFYYGPERLSPRFEHDEKTRLESGSNEAKYKTILDHFEAAKAEVRTSLPVALFYARVPLCLHGRICPLPCLPTRLDD